MANLSLKHIYKVYPNGTKAVNDFNMEIEDKEFIVFVGPSGCGKSTMLRMIAGLEDISAGELSIGETVVNDVEPKDRDIAMVFQNYALYPHMTVYENIAFGLRVRKMSNEEIHERVVHAAEILGIKDYLDRKPKEMSGGQRQRVSLGRAIVRNPKVMLLDEPLSNLDAKLRTQMRAEILKLHKQLNTTFIYVTHDQVEAMTMGTRIVVMKSGFVQQIDTPKNLYRYPENKFVAGFIGTPQMNFFEGTLKRDGNKVAIAFKNTDASIYVPYEFLRKVRPKYLNGEASVCIGIRAEDVAIAPNVVSASPYKIRMAVSHVEDLGDESLIYGDINLNGDGYSESPTRIIVKTTLSHEYRSGEVCEVAFNVKKLHFFDAETEETIVPRIPEVNEASCEVRDGVLTWMRNSVKLPPAFGDLDGKGTVLIPTNAITFDGNLDANVVGCEQVLGKHLISLEMNGERMFAVSDTEMPLQAVKVGLDLKRITLTIDGRTHEPLHEVVQFKGKVIKKKETEVREVGGKSKRQKVINFYLDVSGAQFVAPEHIARKVFSTLSPRAVFATDFLYEFTPYDIKIDGKGIEGEVTGMYDYGAEKFAQIRIGEDSVNVHIDAPVSGKVFLSPNFDRAGVIEAARGIRII
ncbi:MAG TPA: sn-glycerol-3-phosphate ABC transporter ATP-binding protein UgpC [Candidatus Borkfalkia excrementigallinarum]|uniref:Sn-glycerol-3-phosphate ABC transporter ATP-binding protein UgpC n=2 Tax=Clostridia TaxID=186801 RepID=A0A9D1ZW51_9FIRM|nr:sn-glycerol-3-phosphate ABC transporter ATP-binding protein UgpC [Candidatus Borkfalkia excrementigallinarum]HIZ72420.1 sn-glycerol-3-phosphate ABC transporter ATP-binding protein UgpC [Candidatus Gallimonas intestinavium]